MGLGGNLKVYNATQNKYTQTSNHTYQMDAWNVPAEFESFKSFQFYVEFDTGFTINPWDDGANTKYNLDNSEQVLVLEAHAELVSGNTVFSLRFQGNWGSTGGPLSEPYYIFWATGDSRWRLLTREERTIGWAHDGVVDLKIVEVNYYCGSEFNPSEIIEYVITGEFENPTWQAFSNVVEEAMKNM